MNAEFEFEASSPPEFELDKFDFLFPARSYHGDRKPENLVFDANLQRFSQKVSYISALETGGKLSPQEAFQQIDGLWQQLQTSKENLLGVGEE
jgi:hypothetical protein